MPEFISVRKHGSCERTGCNKTREENNQRASAAENSADDRKKEIEHLFDRKGPQDIPIARQVAAARFEDVDVESESCQ